MNSFKVGDKVILRADVLLRHARKTPAACGHGQEGIIWRKQLAALEGQTGIISRVFDGSKHVNVDFVGGFNGTIGIDSTELVPPDYYEAMRRDLPVDSTVFAVRVAKGRYRLFHVWHGQIVEITVKAARLCGQKGDTFQTKGDGLEAVASLAEAMYGAGSSLKANGDI